MWVGGFVGIESQLILIQCTYSVLVLCFHMLAGKQPELNKCTNVTLLCYMMYGGSSHM